MQLFIDLSISKESIMYKRAAVRLLCMKQYLKKTNGEYYTPTAKEVALYLTNPGGFLERKGNGEKGICHSSIY
jgi:hypothetical protein